MLEAMGSSSCAFVGYTDADLATPPSELLRLAQYLDESAGVDMVMGARIAFLGARIDRSPLRHYLGRFFATGASFALKKPVYDTQCGAKVFRVDERLKAACGEPFRSGWAFDVELLARLLTGDRSYVVHERRCARAARRRRIEGHASRDDERRAAAWSTLAFRYRVLPRG